MVFSLRFRDLNLIPAAGLGLLLAALVAYPFAQFPILGVQQWLILMIGAGVVLPDTTQKAFQDSAEAVQAMLADSDTQHRCRRTAKDVFDLEQGVCAYNTLYDQLLRATHVN